MSERRFLGTFGSSDPNQHYGELTVDGENTAIHLIGKDLTAISAATTIFGHTTHGKVSCIDCISTSAKWSFDGTSRSAQAKIFPHYVVRGLQLFDPERASIAGITFRFTDIDILFGNSGSVDSFLAPAVLMESVFAASQDAGTAAAGDAPVVSYYAGEAEEWGLQTAVGTISIRNVVEFAARRPFTHRLDMSIAFNTPLRFKESIDTLLRIRQCMTCIAGRAQALDDIRLTVHDPENGASRPCQLNLEWCLSPKGPAESESAPSLFGPPIDRLDRSEEFAKVLSGWFARDEAWYWPRTRYVQAIEQGRHYSAERLVAAANMFDLLPDAAYNFSEGLPPDVAEAKAVAKVMFRKLPKSIDRDSFLNALGRIGKPSLAKKVAQRANVARSHLSPRLPALDKVMKAAVLCRNYLVHGGEFDIAAVEPYLDLMTDSLEFVFIASDLIELGWNASAWAKKSGNGAHRFSNFLHAYSTSINDFVCAFDAIDSGQ